MTTVVVDKAFADGKAHKVCLKYTKGIFINSDTFILDIPGFVNTRCVDANEILCKNEQLCPGNNMESTY